MCGRYSQTQEIESLQKRFRFETLLDLIAPRYNIAPSQEAPVILWDGRPTLALLRWGLVPFWAKDASSGASMINARSETVARKPAFRTAFQRQRCLVIADGFYEWVRRKNVQGKQPYRFIMKDGQPFAFAGVWDRWNSPQREKPLLTFSVLTTQADPWMAQYHHRMPVVLKPEDETIWLDPENRDQDRLLALLDPPLKDRMTAYPVSTFVNAPANDTPFCIERSETETLFQEARPEA